MTYHFKHGDASATAALRRIALAEIGAAIDGVDQGGEPHRTVHQIRKRCKKLRGLVRLVRASFPGYAAENAAFRDAARPLSHLRDSEALIETLESILKAYDDQVDRAAFASVRRRLKADQKEAAAAFDIDERLAQFRAAMQAARKRAAGWQLERDGFDALRGGLRKSYARARHAMAAASADPSPECFHEWRKRTKDHWYHARLLRPIWPGPMGAHCEAADRLGDLLGDHHDLAVFRARLTAAPEAFGAAADVEVLLALIQRRRIAIEAEAFSRGAYLLAEPPGALRRRWRSYWEAWREAGPADPTALAA